MKNEIFSCTDCDATRFFIRKRSPKKSFSELNVENIDLEFTCVNCNFTHVITTKKTRMYIPNKVLEETKKGYKTIGEYDVAKGIEDE